MAIPLSDQSKTQQFQSVLIKRVRLKWMTPSVFQGRIDAPRSGHVGEPVLESGTPPQDTTPGAAQRLTSALAPLHAGYGCRLDRAYMDDRRNPVCYATTRLNNSQEGDYQSPDDFEEKVG